MLYYKSCLLFTGFLSVNALIIPNQDNGLSVCVNKILSQIMEFKNFTADVSLIDIENDVIQNLQIIKGARFNIRTPSWINNDIFNTIYVMKYKDYTNMKNGFNVIMNDNYWTPTANFIIILQHFEEQDLNRLTRFLVFNNLYNVNILSAVENDYTINTFQPPIHACNRSPHLVKITQCSMYNGGSYIFPTISLQSLRGCRFKLAAYNFYPMVNFDKNKSDGWEQRLMQLFAERNSMAINLVELSKLGRMVGNFTYKDIMSKIRDGEVEGVIGGYFLHFQALGKFSFGYPIVIDHLVLIMSKAEFYDTWRAVFHKAFYVIMFVFGLIIIFSVLAYLLDLFPSHNTDPIRDFIIIFGYFLNKITVRVIKKGVPETLVTFCLLFSVFIIPYSIQAFMCSLKTHPIRGYEAENSEEVYEKYQLIVPSEWGKFMHLPNTMDCKTRLGCLKKVLDFKDRDYYTMLSEIIYDVYKWRTVNDQCSLDVYKIRDPVYTLMRTVYFRHGSVIVKAYDTFLLDIAASGLIKKMIEDLIYNERLKCRFRAKPIHGALSLKELQQSFTILISGYCLSAICFAYEIVTKKRWCL